jgi:hypothetical protein
MLHPVRFRCIAARYPTMEVAVRLLADLAGRVTCCNSASAGGRLLVRDNECRNGFGGNDLRRFVGPRRERRRRRFGQISRWNLYHLVTSCNIGQLECGMRSQERGRAHSGASLADASGFGGGAGRAQWCGSAWVWRNVYICILSRRPFVKPFFGAARELPCAREASVLCQGKGSGSDESGATR